MKALTKNYGHLAIAILIFLLVSLLIPTVNGLTSGGAAVIGIFVAAVYMWITIGVGWPSFLVITGLCFVAGTFTGVEIFANSFGSFMMPLMIAVLILNDALNQVGITKRIATWFITRKAVKNRPWVFIGMFILAGIVLEMFMELIPPIIIMLAICDSICSDLGYERDDSFPKALRMGILWTSVVAYGSSPIAHSIVVIILNNIEKATGIAISYLQYLGVGIPFVLLFFGATMLVLKFIVRPDVSKFVHYDLEKVQGETKPLGLRGKLVVAIFALVVFLWIFPNFGGYISFLAPVANFFKSFAGALPAIPPMIGIVLLSLIHAEGKPLINFSESLNRINWSAILFTVCIVLLGYCFTSANTGITPFLQSMFAPLSSMLSPFGIVAVALVICLALTNFMSNLLSSQLVFAAFLPVLIGMVGPSSALVLVMGVGVGLMANTAFLTPSANPGAPIIFSQGLPVKEGLKYGWIMMLIGYALMMIVAYPLASWILG
ncbi:MAG: hypothetical protein GX417_04875 [Clostridiales bacterium]|nr:hypothetical protein [Clostridiales bacterium]